MILYNKLLKINESRKVDYYLKRLDLNVAEQYLIVSHQQMFKVTRVEQSTGKKYPMPHKLYELDELLFITSSNKNNIYDYKEIDFKEYLDTYYGGHDKFYKPEETITPETKKTELIKAEETPTNYSSFDELFEKAIQQNLILFNENDNKEQQRYKLNENFIDYLSKNFSVAKDNIQQYFTYEIFKEFLPKIEPDVHIRLAKEQLKDIPINAWYRKRGYQLAILVAILGLIALIVTLIKD